jgi:PAS domain S-box-containing protein
METPDLQASNLLDAMPDAVLLVGFDGVVAYANTQVEAMFGHACNELLGKNVEILLPELSRAGNELNLAEYFAAPFSCPLSLSPQLLARRRDGTELPVHVSLSTVAAPFGRIAVVIIRDITERERLNASVRLSEEKYRLLVERASEIIYRVSIDKDPMRGRVDFVSPQCETLTGHSAEEFLENPRLWSELIHEEDLKDLYESTKTMIDTQSSRTRTYRIHCKHLGEYRWVEDRVTPLLDAEGAFVGYQGVARDVTEARHLEEQQRKLEEQLRQAQKMEAVGRLAGGIAHDFNNYLTIILGYCSTMLSGLDPGHDFYEGLRQVHDAGMRSAELTRQLLGFARKQIISPRILNLNASLTKMESLLRRSIGEDIRFNLALSPDPWPVRLDESQFDQVIMNLTANARDSMVKGGSLTIETRNALLTTDFCAGHSGVTPGEYVLVSVTDTGQGMDERVLKNAFEPFFTTKPHGQGTGLGLATIYGIVKQNQGFIDLVSSPGSGTSVHIYIPRTRETAEVVATPDASISRAGETVMVVEDNAQLRKLTRKLLLQLGYLVVEAETPEHALSLASDSERGIQLVLTDVVMPGINGLELAREMETCKPRPRVLFMSGYPQVELARYGISKTGVPLLQKPFDQDELNRAVRQVLDSVGSAADS